jgi:hypothetical protein
MKIAHLFIQALNDNWALKKCYSFFVYRWQYKFLVNLVASIIKLFVALFSGGSQ